MGDLLYWVYVSRALGGSRRKKIILHEQQGLVHWSHVLTKWQATRLITRCHICLEKWQFLVCRVTQPVLVSTTRAKKVETGPEGRQAGQNFDRTD